MSDRLVARAPGAQSIRVLTLNIYGKNADWPSRLAVIQNGLDLLRPDLVALQETVVRAGDDQVAELFGVEWHVAHAANSSGNRAGVSIVSRYPIASVHELELPLSSRDPEFQYTTLVAKVIAPPPIGTILFVNHFPDASPPHEHLRERQAVVAARYIEKYMSGNEVHVVLAGDLDAELDAASVRFLTGRQSLEGVSVCYRDAWEWLHPEHEARTYTRRNALMASHNAAWPFECIDHIFVRCGRHGRPTLDIVSCDVVFNEPVDGVWASDHYALVADLSLPVPAIDDH